MAAVKAAQREGRRHTIGIRVTAEAKQRLEQDASRAGRSLTQEIETKLERAIMTEDAFGGPEIMEVCRDLAGYIVRIERETQRGLLDTLGPEQDQRLDAQIRWLLGQIIWFKRTMRAPSDVQAIQSQANADDEAHSPWIDDDGSTITIAIPKVEGDPKKRRST